ncbi:hypothetical protein [Flavobacterium coralii]|uniref:hypothetical protein n=1 Tax=Flavobacterium coralii TaxID=2838017 RepID=UPI000C4AB214|nr:hypothetical protein [Flavobacterium sp.]|tara:strand:+ start:9554 stop:9760 length:207 start_codon:yes stop_codon:yes gene_type:complete
MKKVVLSMALIAMMSVSFVSCKEKAEEAPVEETTEVEVETPAVEETAVEVDTMAVDTTAAATEAPAAH